MAKEEAHFDPFEVDRCRGMGKIYWTIVCVVFLSCIFLGNKGVKGEELDVREILSKVWWKYRNAEDEKERVKITLRYRDGREIVKELFKWTQFSTDGKDKLAIKFTLPVGDKGLGLLTFRDPVKRDVHWLKKPSLRKRCSMKPKVPVILRTRSGQRITFSIMGCGLLCRAL